MVGRILIPPPERGHSCPQQPSRTDTLGLAPRPVCKPLVAADRNVRAPAWRQCPDAPPRLYKRQMLRLGSFGFGKLEIAFDDVVEHLIDLVLETQRAAH